MKELFENLKVKLRSSKDHITKKIVGSRTEVRVSTYETTILTEGGKTYQEADWKQAVLEQVEQLKETHIFEELKEYAKELAWIRLEEIQDYAIELYSSRIWENEEWVGYKEFNEKVLTTKIKNDNINLTNKTTEKDGNEMIRLTKKDLMSQIKIMRNDLIDGTIDKAVDNCGSYERINTTKSTYWGIEFEHSDYEVKLKNCTLLKTPAFKKEVAKYLVNDFEIKGVKIVVGGLFGTAEVLVDVEDVVTGDLKEVCYLWDNKCNYSKYKELDKQYPNAQEDFEREEEIIIEKMEEKEMTTTKAQLRNRLNKLGKVFMETTDTDEITDAVYDLFPNAMEVGLDEKMELDFIVGEEYTGAKPTKKVMKEIDEDFDYIMDMSGLSVYVEKYNINEENKIRITADLHIKYRDKFGCVHEDGVDVVEIMIDVIQNENAVEEKMLEVYNNCNTALNARYGAKKLEKYLENNKFVNDVLERTVASNIECLKNLEKTYTRKEKHESEENRATRFMKVADEVLDGKREDVDKNELIDRLSRLDFDMLTVDTIEKVADKMSELRLGRNTATNEETVGVDGVVFVVTGTDNTLEVFDNMDVAIGFAYSRAKEYGEGMSDVEIVHNGSSIKLIEKYRDRTSTLGKWTISVKNINKKEEPMEEQVKETILTALAQENNKKYIGDGIVDTGKRTVAITELGEKECTKRD